MSIGTNANAQEKRRSKSQILFLCPTPSEFCYGKKIPAQGVQLHSSAEEVKRCERNYLLKNGYKQIGTREFINPDGGCIMVLSKKANRAKPGKGDRYMVGKQNRVVCW